MIFQPWNWCRENYSIVQSQTRNIKQLHYNYKYNGGNGAKQTVKTIQVQCLAIPYLQYSGINSTVEISWDMFKILADYRLRHLVNNVAIHMITLEWR
jgi:hypothetical protein